MSSYEDHIALLKKLDKEKIENSPNSIHAKKLANEAIELTRYRNERNLMLYPFCSTSRRKRLKTIEYTSSDGKRFLEVSANHKYGMAKIWDFDILRFAISKAGEIAMNCDYFPSSVEFSAYECLKAIGRNPKAGKNVKWLEQALCRLVSTTYKGSIFRDDTKITEGFTLISFNYEETNDGEIKRIRITFNERLVESIRCQNTLLAIDKDVINEESGIKKRLLELVKVSKGNSLEWIVGLERLAEMCAHDGELKKFKKLLKSYKLPWKVAFSKRIDGENVRFESKNGEP